MQGGRHASVDFRLANRLQRSSDALVDQQGGESDPRPGGESSWVGWSRVAFSDHVWAELPIFA